MAVITGNGGAQVDNYYLYEWTGLANGDTGRPLRVSGLADKTIQLDGTFGTGGSMSFEGSMDNTNWYTLNDPQGNALAMTAAGIESVLENPRFVRPNIKAGDGTTSLNVRLGASTLR